MVGAPRNIFKFPSMCATTKPTKTRPVTAITTFLPTIVRHSTTNGWLDQTPRGVAAAAKFAVLELDALMLLAKSSDPFLVRFDGRKNTQPEGKSFLFCFRQNSLCGNGAIVCSCFRGRS